MRVIIQKVWSHIPEDREEALLKHYESRKEALAHKSFWNSQGAKVKVYANWLELPVVNGETVYPDNYQKA